MRILSSFYVKLILALTILAIILSIVLIQVWLQVNSKYSHEVVQTLNKNIAMYITNAHPLIDNKKINHQELEILANRAMVTNPSIEIYLLDPQGKIISKHDDSNIKIKHVDISAIQAFLQKNAVYPIFGDNPKHTATKNVFSVSPIIQDGETKAYIYVVLQGQMHKNLISEAKNSHILTLSLATLLGSLLFFLISSILIVLFFTKKLSMLNKKVKSFHFNNFESFKDFSLESKNIEKNISLYQHQLTQQRASNLSELEELELSIYSMVKHIQEQFKKIESVDNTRRELIANISHDLRTPLAAQLGYIETLILKNDTLDNEQRINFLNIIFKQGNKLSVLVEQLLELSKLESGKTELNIERFSLTELIHDSIQDSHWKAQQKNIKLNFKNHSQAFTLNADIGLIQRALQNLIDNAIKHSPKNRSIDIGFEQQSSSAHLYIQDHGKGIKEHDLPFIFERFYQSKDNTHSSKIGSGLGLAIVKRILDLHQFKITVDSKQPHGTRFMIHIPKVNKAI